MNNELIHLVNIHKTYRMGYEVVEVLRGVDLVVQEGEFVAIMGASGSGKSTLLHIAGALDRPDPAPLPQGRKKRGERDSQEPPQIPTEVRFRGEPLSAMSARARHHLRNQEFGFVFQFYHLLPELTVLENVLLPAMVEAPSYKALLRVRPRKPEALRLIEAFGLQHRMRHRPAQLSGGERQRVAIARALINQPALLLADEPTGNLDAKTGRAILDVLINLHRQKGQTLLLVTHDPAVANLADRTVHLVEGKIRNGT